MKRRVAFAALGALVFVAMTLTVRQTFTQHGFGGADLVPLWLGGRALLFERSSPYSPTVTLRAQQMILGAAAPSGTDQFAFAYPLIALLPLAPLLVLPFDFAQAAWLTASLGIIVVSVLALARWPRGLNAALLLVGALAFYPTVRVLALGQFSPFVFGCMVLFIRAADARANRIAGIALALACVKPQMSFLIVPVALIWAWRHGRQSVIVSFVVSGMLLLLVALLVWPTWIGEWVARLLEYRDYSPQPAPLELLLGTYATAASGLVLLVAVVFWWRAQPNLRTTVVWLIPLTLITAPRTSVSDQILLLTPITLAWARLRLVRRIGLLASVVAFPWLWHALTQANGKETAAMVWPLPVISLGALLCLVIMRTWSSRSA